MIALTKASLIYWTCPIFTAIFAGVHLRERITQYDWVAAFLAFFGIVLMQNPFTSSPTGNSQLVEMLGSVSALMGAITAGFVFMSIKKMGTEVHYVMSPLSWAVSNLILCPVFTGI